RFQNHAVARAIEDNAKSPKEAAADIASFVGLRDLTDVYEPGNRIIKSKATQLKLRESAHRHVYRSAHPLPSYGDGFADRFAEFVLINQRFSEHQRIGRAGVKHEKPFDGLPPGSHDFGFHGYLMVSKNDRDALAGAAILIIPRLVQIHEFGCEVNLHDKV